MRPKKLPAVLSGEEVNRLLSCVSCLKHRRFLLTRYAAGLRLNEAARLTIPDIDSQRMQLRVDCGKGQKTRIVPMSPRLLTELREYWKTVRSPKYLFPGKTFDVPLSSTTIQKMFKVAAQKAGILKDVTPHTLRHSYATGLLEAGVDLLTISRLLGHASFSTTMIYLHVRTLHLGSAPSPIDWLPIRQLPGWMQPPNSSPQNPPNPNPPQPDLP
jgi:integrase/recombinase XerD